MLITVQKRGGKKRPDEVFWFGWNALLECSRNEGLFYTLWKIPRTCFGISYV